MKSSLYSIIFQNILFEDNFSGDGGALGSASPIYSPDNISSGNTYAPDDSRNIFGRGKPIIQRRNKVPNLISKKRRKKGKKQR